MIQRQPITRQGSIVYGNINSVASSTNTELRWSETKNVKIFIIDGFFAFKLDDNETLYSYRTWKYIAKTEVKMFLTVMVSMATV